MKKKQWSRIPGKMICGFSVLFILSAAGQDKDPNGYAENPTGTAPQNNQNADPFGGGGGPSNDPFGGGGGYNPFRKGKAAEILINQQDQVAMMIEMIEVDHLTANNLMLEFGKNANDVGLMRERLFELIKKGDAKLQETLWGRSPLNEASTIEAIVEKIYPTEYEPPQLPSFVAGTPDDKTNGGSAQVIIEMKGDLYTSATPLAFDTKNTGITLEFEAAKSADQPEEIALAIDFIAIKFVQYDHYSVEGNEDDARGVSNIVMPRFSVMKQNFLVNVTPGNHSLLGMFKDGADESDLKRIIVLLHVDLIAKE